MNLFSVLNNPPVHPLDDTLVCYKVLVGRLPWNTHSCYTNKLELFLKTEQLVGTFAWLVVEFRYSELPRPLATEYSSVSESLDCTHYL